MAGSPRTGRMRRMGPKLPTLRRSRRMHTNRLPAARCSQATLFGKIDDLLFASLRVHIDPKNQLRRMLGCAIWLIWSLWRLGS